MSSVTVVWSLTAGACLSLGLVYFLVWLNQREGWANFWFASATISVAALAAAELMLMQATSVQAYTVVQRWAHVPAFVTVVSIPWFVHLYFQPGLKWLLWLITLCRCLVLVINFSSPASANYLEITALIPIELLGEAVQVAMGVPNPWSRLGEVSLLLVVLFVLHAAAVIWRRNAPRDRRRAVVIGMAVSVFVLFSAANVFLLHTGRVTGPYFLSMAFMLTLVAMSYELSVDLFRSAELARQLQDSTARLDLAASAANLGFWEYDPVPDRFWVSYELQRLYGFAEAERITLGAWLSKVHPDDRAAAGAEAADHREWRPLQVGLSGPVAERAHPVAGGPRA